MARPLPVPNSAHSSSKAPTPVTDGAIAAQKSALNAFLASSTTATLHASLSALQSQINALETPDIKKARRALALLNTLS